MKDALKLTDSAFRAILEGDDRAARVTMAKAQRDEYGMKDWSPEKPTKDVLDQAIVYRDSYSGERYEVRLVQSDGSHVRVFMTGSAGSPMRRFGAYALAMADVNLVLLPLILNDLRIDPKSPDLKMEQTGKSGDFHYLRVKYDPMPLD